MKTEDTAFEQKTGWAMTYQDLYKALENYRTRDLALYLDKKTRKQAEFHFAFRPGKQPLQAP